MRENRYLRDRMIGRDMRYDGRNKYGSEGGYISSTKDRSDYHNDYEERENFRGRHNRDYNEHYERYNDYGNRSDYASRSDYRERDRESNDVYKKYERDLEMWVDELKKKDKFKLSKEEIINRARSMGIRFENYSMEEFIAVYYMIMSDFPSIANDSGTYLQMTKKWLEDDDIEVSPSEKLCIYYYDIVRGKCLQ